MHSKNKKKIDFLENLKFTFSNMKLQVRKKPTY